MILGVNKQIFQLKRNGDGTYGTELVNKKWIEKSYYKYLLGTIQYSELKPNSTLYFSKSSSFPRLKLENSCFKRCIKIAKADYEALEDNALMNDPIEVIGELDSGFFARKFMLKVIISDLKVGVA